VILLLKTLSKLSNPEKGPLGGKSSDFMAFVPHGMILVRQLINFTPAASTSSHPGFEGSHWAVPMRIPAVL
jgi:hypothetical protein